MTLNEALAIAEKAHAGQKNKAGGPYIDFLKSVADFLYSEAAREVRPSSCCFARRSHPFYQTL